MWTETGLLEFPTKGMTREALREMVERNVEQLERNARLCIRNRENCSWEEWERRKASAK